MNTLDDRPINFTSIPAIAARRAADTSNDVSLYLLRQVERTVDALTEIERGLEMVQEVARGAEKLFWESEPPKSVVENAGETIGVLQDAVDHFCELHEVFKGKKRAARIARELNGEHEDQVVLSYDRALDGLQRAVEALESLKWTLMDIQALSEPRSDTFDNASDLIAELER